MISQLRWMIRHDVTPREVLILNELIEKPGICRSTLASNLGFTASSAVYPALRRMMDRQWVVDGKSPVAARSDPSILNITLQGRGVLSDLLTGVE